LVILNAGIFSLKAFNFERFTIAAPLNKISYIKLLFTFCLVCVFGPMAKSQVRNLQIDYYGEKVSLPVSIDMEISFGAGNDAKSVKRFYEAISKSKHCILVDSLLSYRRQNGLDDWFYYQLIRRTAQQLAPKADNYYRYTLYKWFLLVQSGYDATLSTFYDQLLFHVYSTEEVFGIPYYTRNSRQYVCLNIHDYAQAALEAETTEAIDIAVPGATKPFSYKVTRMPEFYEVDYTEKSLQFEYRSRNYQFAIKLNPQIRQAFANYPGLDFGEYFNTPMSNRTYQSLVPLLRKNVARMSERKGVDYLMHFTRYAFLYEKDESTFGKEKRMVPEETLMYDKSDCEDRAALFFFLVKEIYNLPMLALMYPTHINIAVQFSKRHNGEFVLYEGKKFTICEPTPQSSDLPIGKQAEHLRNVPPKVVYAYIPNDSLAK
jgi:hypothetical protein